MHGQTYNKFYNPNKRDRWYTIGSKIPQLQSKDRQASYEYNQRDISQVLRRIYGSMFLSNSYMIDSICFAVSDSNWYNNYSNYDSNYDNISIASKSGTDLRNIAAIILLYSHHKQEIEFYEKMQESNVQVINHLLILQKGCENLLKLNKIKCILRVIYVLILILIVFPIWSIENENQLSNFDQFKGFCTLIIQSSIINFIWIAENLQTRRLITLLNIYDSSMFVNAYQEYLIEKVTTKGNIDVTVTHVNQYIFEYFPNNYGLLGDYKLAKIFKYSWRFHVAVLILPVCVFILPVHLLLCIIILLCSCINIDIILKPSKFLQTSTLFKRVMIAAIVILIQIEFFAFMRLVESDSSFQDLMVYSFGGKYCQNVFLEGFYQANFGHVILQLTWMFL